MADAIDPAAELERIEAALAAQEALRSILPEDTFFARPAAA